MSGPRIVHAQRHCIDDKALTTVRLARVLRLRLEHRRGCHADCRYELYDGERRISAEDARTGPRGEVRELIPDVECLELRVWLDAGDIPEVYHLNLGIQGSR